MQDACTADVQTRELPSTNAADALETGRGGGVGGGRFSPASSTPSPLAFLQDKGHPVAGEGHQSLTLALTQVRGDQTHHFLRVLPQGRRKN